MRTTRAGLLPWLALAACFPELGEFDSAATGGGDAPIDRDESWAPSGGAGGLSAGGASSSGGGGGATLEACDSGLLCLDESGREGWSGPFLVLAGAGAECPVAYPEPASALHELVNWSNPCACSCDAPTGIQCSARVAMFDNDVRRFARRDRRRRTGLPVGREQRGRRASHPLARGRQLRPQRRRRADLDLRDHAVRLDLG